jgi:hypothetical protein
MKALDVAGRLVYFALGFVVCLVVLLFGVM